MKRVINISNSLFALGMRMIYEKFYYYSIKCLKSIKCKANSTIGAYNGEKKHTKQMRFSFRLYNRE